MSARRLQKATTEGRWSTPCIYCGATATDRDHFVPRRWRALMVTWRQEGWKDAPDTVPACGECNGIAGARPFATLVEKRQFIHHRLRQKHSRLLSAPVWTEAQLEELGYELRTRIMQEQTKLIRLLLRLSWPYDQDEEIEALTEYLLERAAA